MYAINGNKNLDFKIIKDLDTGLILKQNIDFKNNIYFIEAKCHLVNFPEIDYWEKVNYLENVIKIMSNRGWNIKSAIEWVKFTQGLA